MSLIKGSIDQISRHVRITWVQPRVLDRPQIEALKRKLEAWGSRVDKVAEYASGHGGAEVLAVA